MPPETEIIGRNALVIPHPETWGWEVAVYLFLGGLVAGLLIVSAVLRVRSRERYARAIRAADLLGFPLLAIGMLLLWIDLGQRWNAWQFYTTLRLSSPMSWGSWILVVAFAVLVLRASAALPAGVIRRLAPVRWLTWLARRTDGALDLLALVLGPALGAYTGFLLSAIAARPLWDSPWLPVLFLASGLDAAAALLWSVLRAPERRRLTLPLLALTAAELTVLAVYVLGLGTGTAAQREAVALLTQGTIGAIFIVGTVLFGQLVAITAGALELAGRELPKRLERIPAVLQIGGSLALRIAIVYAGLRSAL